MSEDFDINIRTTADLTAADKAAESQRKLARETDKAAEAAGRQAKESEKLNTSLNDSAQGADSVDQLNQGMQAMGSGNVVGGIKGLTMGIRALWTTLAANPIGVVLAALTALAGVFAMLRGRSKETALQMEEDAQAFEAYAAGVRKQKQEIEAYSESIKASLLNAGNASKAFAGETAFDTLIRQLELAKNAASRLRVQTEALADAELSAALAGIDEAVASGNMTEPDAERARNQARIRAGEIREQARRTELQEQARLADEKAAGAAENQRLAAQQAAEAQLKLKQRAEERAAVGVGKVPTADIAAELERVKKTYAKLDASAGQLVAGGDSYNGVVDQMQRLQERWVILQRALDDKAMDALQEAQAAAAANLDDAAKKLAAAKQQQALQSEDTSFGLGLLDRERATRSVTGGTREKVISNTEASEAAKAEAKVLQEQNKALESSLKEQQKLLKAQRRESAEALAEALAQKEAQEASAATAAADAFDTGGFRSKQPRKDALESAAAREQAQADAFQQNLEKVRSGDQEAIRSTLEGSLSLAQQGDLTPELLDLARRNLAAVARQAQSSQRMQREISDLKEKLDNLDL